MNDSGVCNFLVHTTKTWSEISSSSYNLKVSDTKYIRTQRAGYTYAFQSASYRRGSNITLKFSSDILKWRLLKT